MRKTVLLLDRSYFPVSIIPWRKALDLVVLRQCAEAVKMRDDSQYGFSVVRLLYRSIPPNFRGGGDKVKKRAILERDHYQCAYCGSKNKKILTIDHILPKSRGGRDTHQNLITACLPCNNWKSDRTPVEAGMRMLYAAQTPKLEPMPGLMARLDEWRDFLGVYQHQYKAA